MAAPALAPALAAILGAALILGLGQGAAAHETDPLRPNPAADAAPAEAPAGKPADGGGAPLPFAFGGAFSLVDHWGVRRSDADFRGAYMLVFFGYTSCPNTCSTALLTIAGALDGLGAEGARVQPLFITVDPGHDTPERLAAYVAKFHPRLVGLTGTSTEVAAARKVYRVHAVRLADPGRFERLVDHSSLTYLMGPDGRFLTLLPPILTAERMARIIAGYME